MQPEPFPAEGGHGDWETFKARPAYSIDFLTIGNSHAHTTIAPLQVWNEYGVTSWMLSASGLNWPGREAYLAEALKTQTPKVVAIEAGRLNEVKVRHDAPNVWAYEHMPWSVNKVRAILTTVEPRRMEYVSIPFVRNHHRYLDLGRDDVVATLGDILDKKRSSLAGASFHSNTWDGTIKDFEAISATDVERAEANLVHVRNIAEMCREQGIALVMFVAPKHEGPRNGALMRWAQTRLKDEYPEITWVDLHDHYPELQLESPADYRDAGHLNLWGAEKVTRYFVDRFVIQHVPGGSSLSVEDRAWWDDMARRWTSRVRVATAERVSN